MDTDAPKETGPMLTPVHPGRRAGGFSLIELLVVIAIIAIISAILFPVFFAVREKARQGTVMDDFRQINTALAKYKLDHHRYPPVLFGYAVAGASMGGAKAAAGTHDFTYFPGLYPEYINDPSVFTDPNNPVTDPSAVWPTAPAMNSLSSGTLTPLATLATTPPVAANFYVADAYDANVNVASPGTLGTTPVTRYQLAWTNFPPPNGVDGTRELAYPNPAADTFVTCTTYHAGPGIAQGKVLVLFVDGSAKTLDDTKFLAAAGTADDGTAADKFWQVTP